MAIFHLFIWILGIQTPHHIFLACCVALKTILSTTNHLPLFPSWGLWKLMRHTRLKEGCIYPGIYSQLGAPWQSAVDWEPSKSHGMILLLKVSDHGSSMLGFL